MGLRLAPTGVAFIALLLGHGCFIPGGDSSSGDEGGGTPSCQTSCERLTKRTCYTTKVPQCVQECDAKETAAFAAHCDAAWNKLMACCSSCGGGGDICEYAMGCGPDQFTPCKHPCPAEWEAVEQCMGAAPG